MKQGILLAGAGSRHRGAESSLRHMLRLVRERWPDLPCLAARTSGGHGSVPEARGQHAPKGLPTLQAALDHLAGLGVRHAVIQSLHIIPGREYHGLLRLAQERRKAGAFDRVSVGAPLLGSEADIDAVARAALTVLPGRTREEAVLFMGHGAKHPGHDFYPALAARLQDLDPRVFLGTMDAGPGLPPILERLGELGVRTVHLLPLFFGAGTHATRDMAGEDGRATSWRVRLEARGFACRPVLKGAGEQEALAGIWLDHLQHALNGQGA